MVTRFSLLGIDEITVPAFVDTGDPAALQRWKAEHPDWFVAGYATPDPQPRTTSAVEQRDAFPHTGRLPGEAHHGPDRAATRPLDPAGLSLADFHQVAQAARQGRTIDPDTIQAQYQGPGRGAASFRGLPRTPAEDVREFRFYEALRTLRELEPRNPLAEVLRDPTRTPSEDVVRTLEQEARDAILRNANRTTPNGPGEPDPATPLQRRELRKEMIREGFMKPDSPDEAHHIVPGGGEMSGGRDPARSQELLRDFGIDLDSATNGIGLSPKFHLQLHTRGYYEYVEQGLSAAGSRNEAIAFLRRLAQRLTQDDERFQQDNTMPVWKE